MTTGEDPLDATVGDNRQLVDVLAAHQFKRLEGRRIRGNGAQLIERAHHTLHAGLRPAVAIDFLYLMGRDQSRYPVILDDDETAASGSQDILVDKILQTQLTLHSSVVAIHDVGDAPVPESRHQLYLNVAGTGCIKQEPTDKR